MTTTIIIASLTIILGIVILLGKGDMLIAGYNTASKNEREKYDIKRLRLVVGLMLILIGLSSCVYLLDDTMSAVIAFSSLTFVIIIVGLILANTWAKKK